MRSESTRALGQPRLTSPIVGVVSAGARPDRGRDPARSFRSGPGDVLSCLTWSRQTTSESRG